MVPALVAMLPATPLVFCWSNPPGRPGQFDSGWVALITTPSPGPPDWWFCWLAKAAQRAGCSLMHHSSSTKLVPAESLSVTGRDREVGEGDARIVGRQGRVVPVGDASGEEGAGRVARQLKRLAQPGDVVHEGDPAGGDRHIDEGEARGARIGAPEAVGDVTGGVVGGVVGKFETAVSRAGGGVIHAQGVGRLGHRPGEGLDGRRGEGGAGPVELGGDSRGHEDGTSTGGGRPGGRRRRRGSCRRGGRRGSCRRGGGGGGGERCRGVGTGGWSSAQGHPDEDGDAGGGHSPSSAA